MVVVCLVLISWRILEHDIWQLFRRGLALEFGVAPEWLCRPGGLQLSGLESLSVGIHCYRSCRFWQGLGGDQEVVECLINVLGSLAQVALFYGFIHMSVHICLQGADDLCLILPLVGGQS